MLNDISNRMQDTISRIIFDIVIPLLTPLIRIGVLLSLILFISSILHYLLRLYILPTALISEQVYFDFSANAPIARINLLSSQQQWNYIGNGSMFEMRTPIKDKRRFLRSGTFHSINILFILSKSQYNHAQGKFMVNFLISDSNSNPIAKSTRPVVMPYQSQITLAIDAITKWPLYLFGILSENIKVTVNVMNNYQEPIRGQPSSDLIEISLSTSLVHIESAYLSIYPQVSGISYFMYYYPITSAFIGISAISSMLIAVAVIYYMVTSLIQIISPENNLANNRVRSHSIVGEDYDDDNGGDDNDEYPNNDNGNISTNRRNSISRLQYSTRNIHNNNNNNNNNSNNNRSNNNDNNITPNYETNHLPGVPEPDRMLLQSLLGQNQNQNQNQNRRQPTPLTSLHSFQSNNSNYSSIQQNNNLIERRDSNINININTNDVDEEKIEEILSDDIFEDSSEALEENLEAVRLQQQTLIRRRLIS